jgi:hypothetical protein
MTRTQQKLAKQATLFVNCGGKAVTALLRVVLLVVAVLFEAIGILFSQIEEAIAASIKDTEAAPKGQKVSAVAFPLASTEDPMGRLSANLAPEHAGMLTGTVGGRPRR